MTDIVVYTTIDDVEQQQKQNKRKKVWLCCQIKVSNYYSFACKSFAKNSANKLTTQNLPGSCRDFFSFFFLSFGDEKYF